MNKFTLLSAAAAAILLSACAKNAINASPEARATQIKENEAKGITSCRYVGDKAGAGTDQIYMCSASKALSSPEAKKELNPNFNVSFGGSINTDKKVHYPSDRKSNAVGKSPEEACQRAFLSTIISFERRAASQGKRNIRVASYYGEKHRAGNEFECHIGTWHSRVVVHGNVY
ncbi:MAG: hypothetical protein Q4E16_00440 [Neisseria sp.]|nr:hypothetical protein [Neisseria sp.]